MMCVYVCKYDFNEINHRLNKKESVLLSMTIYRFLNISKTNLKEICFITRSY